jgi:hypothetical protein
MTTKVVCESRWGNTAGALFEYQLVATFLATMTLQDIRAALAWIQVTHRLALGGEPMFAVFRKILRRVLARE